MVRERVGIVLLVAAFVAVAAAFLDLAGLLERAAVLFLAAVQFVGVGAALVWEPDEPPVEVRS